MRGNGWNRMTVWSKAPAARPMLSVRMERTVPGANLVRGGSAQLCCRARTSASVQDINSKRVCRMAQLKPAPASLCWMSRVHAIAEYFRPIH